MSDATAQPSSLPAPGADVASSASEGAPSHRSADPSAGLKGVLRERSRTPSQATAPATFSDSSDGELPVLGEVIEDLGVGLAQVRGGLIGGGAYFADGAELLLISAVTDSVSQEWNLSPFQRGFIVTIVFLGILIGNFSSGPLSDSQGRRKMIISSFLGVFVFSIVSSWATGFAFLCIVRLFVGFSFGIGQPAWNTLGAEISPSKYRLVMQATSQNLFVLGEIYSAMLILLDDPEMRQLHWRWLCRMGSIPAAVFLVLGVLFLNESPWYLALRGKYEAAKEVLRSMRSDNRAPDVSVEFVLPPQANKQADVENDDRWLGKLRDQLKVIFGKQLRASSLIVLYSCFVLNFGYYGCLYGFARVLPGANTGQSAGFSLLVGALWEFPGNCLGLIPAPRKLMMKAYLCLSVAALVMFTVGLQARLSGLMFAGFYAEKMVVCIGFVVVYQYSTEIYPTNVRTTGCAVNLAGGRVAGMISPIAYELLISMTGHPYAFFYVIAVLCALNFFMIDFLRYETQGRMLKDALTPDPTPRTPREIASEQPDAQLTAR